MRVIRRGKNISEFEQKNDRKSEQGIIILLVAVFMLFVVGAMAALAIDVVTLYTARSEAQLAADAGALAGARVLANSGMTSDATLTATAEAAAIPVAKQVAAHNDVGGAPLANGDVTITFPATAPSSNPQITVQIQVTDLPRFFSRIWGNQKLAVAATATAEAYNPSGAFAIGQGPPVAPVCVKPWLLPNIDPTQTNPAVPIFAATGTAAAGLVGQTWPNTTVTNPNPNGLYSACAGDCSISISLPAAGQYYPGAIDATDFPVPTALPSCAAGFNVYQKAVAGCVQRPVSCGTNSAINPSAINIDSTTYVASTGTRDSDTVQAAGCLIHYNGAATDADSIDFVTTPAPPFEFFGGDQNPVAGARGTRGLVVSESLVTIPVIDYPPGTPPYAVTVIGFLQVFLNPQQSVQPFPFTGPPPTSTPNEIQAMIINAVGCAGTSAGTAPILGNGASPVAVRLITPP